MAHGIRRRVYITWRLVFGEMPGGHNVDAKAKGLDSRDIDQGFVVFGSDLAPSVQEFWELLQLRNAKSALDIRDTVIISQVLHFVIKGHSAWRMEHGVLRFSICPSKFRWIAGDTMITK